MAMVSEQGRAFYVRMGLLYLVLLVAGFVPFMHQRFSAGGVMTPALVLHAVTYFGWFLLFPYQASLVRGRNLKRHMFLGQASLGLVVIMLISAALVTMEAFSGKSNGGTPFTPEHFIILPMMDAVIFPIVYGLGLLNRKVPEVHKHYMLLAGLAILEPATARIGLQMGFPPIGMLIHFGLLAIVMVRDRRVLGAVHKATYVVGAILVVRYCLLFALGPTEAWASFVHWLFG